MPMRLPRDFKDLLQGFIDANVNFLVVGAYAVFIHDRPRATKDIDIWISPTAENAQRAWDAVALFGAPLGDFRVTDLLHEDIVFQIGVQPIRIEILTSISGVTFEESWPNRVEEELDGLCLPFIGAQELLRNKDATGREQDRVDAARIRRRLKRSP